ncbi:MAG: hypothetical protein ACP5G0_04440 [Desulfomonilia bacterium]
MSFYRKNGFSLIIGEDEHYLAPFRKSRDTVDLGDIRDLTSTALTKISRKVRPLKACFSPRSVYADVGEFTSVSQEATTAHIKSSVDKTGLFKEEYRVAYCKLHDLDEARARFSYIATPTREINKIGVLDENESVVDMFCPIEAAIASAVAQIDKNMVVSVYEDTRFVRIIASKEGLIYYLITIYAAESFDLLSDTVSGIHEMISLLKNSYHEAVGCIFKIGVGEVSIEKLSEHGIQIEPVQFDPSGDSPTWNLILTGTAMTTRYDFTPEKHRQTKRLIRYARISMVVSVILLATSAVLLSLAIRNASTAQILQVEMNEAHEKSIRELKTLEHDYLALCKEVDFSNINKIMETYKDFESEPKLHLILSALSEDVPHDMFLRKIEVIRPEGETGQEARIIPSQTQHSRSLERHSLTVVVDGVIESPYPLSKTLFASYLTNIQKIYTVTNATFSHTETNAQFTITCETSHEIL